MYYLAIFPPLFGALFAGIGGRFFHPRVSTLVTCTLMGLACICAWFVFFEAVASKGFSVHLPLMTWIEVGSFRIQWALSYNPLTATLVLVVTTVSFLVHVYSVGYMARDDSIPRFMSYLSLFTFAMLMLVTADNMIQLFFGWEGVGLCSYLLIGFWYHKPAANAAALKAFLVNRVGDLALVLGIGSLYVLFQTLEIDMILRLVPEYARVVYSFWGYSFNALEITGLLLFVGAMGKSAQLGLHTWLPDAMEGPTPVSALIHAATMVTAGVFLVARLSGLYEFTPVTREVMIFVGATTALFAGAVALTQTDIKRIIAFSTCSQLGYMFFAAGLSAYGLAIFHLVTHACFKALLFLAAGSVIHALSDEQDIRKMGGVWRLIPLTYGLMWIGNLALAGVPYFSGYYSKDPILAAAWGSSNPLGKYAYGLGLGSVLLTAVYSWRLLFLVFTGQPRAHDRVMSHAHEPGLSMQIPLIVLAFGSVFSGWIGHFYFLDPDFWRGSLIAQNWASVSASALTHLPLFLHLLPGGLALMGLGIASLCYQKYPSIPEKFSQQMKTLYLFLQNKGYFDELYEKGVVRPAIALGNFLWRTGDQTMINGGGPDGMAVLTLKISHRAHQLQTGYIYHYAFVMVLGVVLWLLYYGL